MADKEDIIGKKSLATPVPEKEVGIDLNDTLIFDMVNASEENEVNTSALESFATAAQTREQIYELIDSMGQDDSVAAVLETYAEDATESNDEGRKVWCESDDSDVLKYVTFLLDSLNIDKNIYDYTYNLIKYGDLYLKLFRESDYDEDVLFGTESKEEIRNKILNESVENKEALDESLQMVVNSVNDHFKHYVERIDNPGEMFELTRFGKTAGFIKAPVTVQQYYDKATALNSYLNYKMKKSDVTVYGPREFVHACLKDNSSRIAEEVSIFRTEDDMKNNVVGTQYKVKRGQSLLYSSFKVWRELSLLENSLMLNRVLRSSVIRLVNVNIGDMPGEQVPGYLSRLKEKIKQKSALDVGKSLTEYTNPAPIENVVMIPTHEGKGEITIDTLGGDGVDVKEISDVDYFKDKFYGSLRVPKQYFGQTDDSTGFNGGTSLSIISSRYAKSIKRIQSTICEMLTDLIHILLLDKGLKSYVGKFTIKMQPPITQEELDKRADMRDRIGIIQDIMGQLSGLNLNETTKAKMLKSLLSSAITDTEIIRLLQEYIEGLEREETEESTEETTTKLPEVEKEEPEFSPINKEERTPISRELEEPTLEEPTEEISEIETSGEESYLPSGEELNVDLTNMEI